MLTEPDKAFTVAEVRELLGVSDNTARSDVRALALIQKKVVEARKSNEHQMVYLSVLK